MGQLESKIEDMKIKYGLKSARAVYRKVRKDRQRELVKEPIPRHTGQRPVIYRCALCLAPRGRCHDSFIARSHAKRCDDAAIPVPVKAVGLNRDEGEGGFFYGARPHVCGKRVRITPKEVPRLCPACPEHSRGMFWILDSGFFCTIPLPPP